MFTSDLKEAPPSVPFTWINPFPCSDTCSLVQVALHPPQQHKQSQPLPFPYTRAKRGALLFQAPKGCLQLVTDERMCVVWETCLRHSFTPLGSHNRYFMTQSVVDTIYCPHTYNDRDSAVNNKGLAHHHGGRASLFSSFSWPRFTSPPSPAARLLTATVKSRCHLTFHSTVCMYH